MTIRVGYGYDVHRLAENRDFWMGGVKIDHHVGLLGHSDADVLIHAICDAVLGAANMRDIGFHFPDTDPKYKGADSKVLLQRTIELIATKGVSCGKCGLHDLCRTSKAQSTCRSYAQMPRSLDASGRRRHFD